jgi:CDP-diacylglycerol--serine O-phosphatidyltransferase
MIARLTASTSAFGLEFDSLADIISFGVAPAILMYLWVLQPFGRIGWVATFIFIACGVLRLARFNVQAQSTQKILFLGVPIPVAASQIVTLYLILTHLEVGSRTSGIVVIVAAYTTSFLMVSSIPYRSWKSIKVKSRHSFYVAVLFILMLAIILIEPKIVLWVLSTTYILSGPAEYLFNKFREGRRSRMEVEDGAAEKEKLEKTSHG